ncbi:MAG: BamA/TamA family outer membrane protein [Candidatus Aminicenantales bacterium]
MMKTKKRFFPFCFLFCLLLWALGPSLQAQYFGRNKVQYEKFDFKLLRTKHFDVYFYPEFQPEAQRAAILAERWYQRLARLLNHELRGRQPLILYASSVHFQQTTTTPEIIGEGTGGFTEILKRRIVLPLGASLAETDHVIGHELVHAFQFDLTAQRSPQQGTAEPTALRLPLWFIEGMSEYLSIGPLDVQTSMWMRDAVRRNDLPTIKKLENPRYFPYRYGHALLAYIAGRWGDEVVGRILKSVGRVGDYEKAMERILGIPIKKLSEDWHKAMKEAYEPLLAETKVRETSSKLVFEGTEENPYNVCPAISPDGRRLVTLSTRDLFSIDLYLADTDTGKIRARLTRTSTSPEFENLQFTRSAGAWDFGGKKFIFAAISKGKPVLSVVSADTGKIEKEISIPQVDEIINPGWSPDGKQVVFSGLKGGVTDLYLYELESGKLKQLTSDPFGDLQPAWSPDGKTIAFVTDRFTTDLSYLDSGEYQLAIVNLPAGTISRVPGFERAKNINPQWSNDGQSLYFLSDQSGKPDIYRVDLKSGQIFQVTNLYTGISGITDISPAFSYAHQAKKIVYSAYENGRYSIFAIDEPEVLTGRAELVQFEGRNLALLPPREQPGGSLLGLLRNPLFGYPEDTNFPVSDYQPKLTLDYVSPPQLAFGVDRYGTYNGGGVALFWSDMLGYHTVATMVQTSNRVKDTAALVGYQNTRKRMNWGVVASRIPYVSGYYTAGMSNFLGQPAYVEQDELFWQINYDAAGFITYPFNQMRRLEFSAGFRYISFAHEIVTNAYSYFDGTLIYRDSYDLPSQPGLAMGYASVAMVYDSAIFGATAPVVGQSYLLEVMPTVGSITYASILGDYRRYFMPLKPFTLAFRLLHYGRYGKDADDERLWPLYLGYETLVRGYNYSSFTYDEFVGAASGFDYNRLFGSKMMVANFELRFPLFGVFKLGRGFYGVLPVDFFTFFDAGVAWSGGEKPSFLGGSKKPITSTGVGVRMNVMGYLVVGINYVHPLSRPNKGWYFQFTISPGF